MTPFRRAFWALVWLPMSNSSLTDSCRWIRRIASPSSSAMLSTLMSFRCLASGPSGIVSVTVTALIGASARRAIDPSQNTGCVAAR